MLNPNIYRNIYIYIHIYVYIMDKEVNKNYTFIFQGIKMCDYHVLVVKYE